jgi:hypothetical protein
MRAKLQLVGSDSHQHTNGEAGSAGAGLGCGGLPLLVVVDRSQRAQGCAPRLERPFNASRLISSTNPATRPRADPALHAAFAAALRAIPSGRQTLMVDPHAPEAEAEAEEGGEVGPAANPLASLLGHYSDEDGDEEEGEGEEHAAGGAVAVRGAAAGEAGCGDRKQGLAAEVGRVPRSLSWQRGVRPCCVVRGGRRVHQIDSEF